ncbi:MAG: Arm DNA-binding domain-containing protein [Pseudomonadota bacterium]
MPKIAKKLTVKEVNALGPGFHNVGGESGLYLAVGDSGSRSWILRAKVGSVRRDIGLGSYTDAFGLKSAREAARHTRDLIRSGIDPVLERQKVKKELADQQAAAKLAVQRQIRFESAAKQRHAKKSDEYRSLKHARDWISSLENHVFPYIGNRPVLEVTTDEILELLDNPRCKKCDLLMKPSREQGQNDGWTCRDRTCNGKAGPSFWHSRTDTAKKVQSRIEKVFDFIVIKNKLSIENPARWKGRLHLFPFKREPYLTLLLPNCEKTHVEDLSDILYG